MEFSSHANDRPLMADGKPVLGDAHAHLESYGQSELDERLDRARDRGVRIIIANGITLRSSAVSVEIACRYPFIRATVGLHPFYAPRLRDAVGPLRKLAVSDRVVGIGEIGLDFCRHPETREYQLPLFDEQLRLARDLDLPVVIHAKWAHQETLKAVKKMGIPEKGAIIQGFREDPAALEDWLDLGFYLSVGVTILFEPSEVLEALIRRIPPERLLLETDASAKRSLSQGLEPATLRTIAEKVAVIREVTLEELGRVTTRNLFEVFRLEEEPLASF